MILCKDSGGKLIKSISRKQTVKKLDNIFSEYIRERDGYVCICCGATRATTIIQCGHLFTAIRFSTRWDEQNGNAQCQPCNFKHEYFPEVYTYAFIQKYGQKAYDKLYVRSWLKMKFSDIQLLAMIDDYKSRLKALKDNS